MDRMHVRDGAANVSTPVPESPGGESPILAKLAPRPGRYPLIPDLTARQKLALLCRTLHREGYDDHIAGHITLAEPGGTFLVTRLG